MVHVGVDVGVKAVLLRCRLVPRRLRLLLGQSDAHDRLRALEAVLPRDHDAHRSAVLVRQHLAVHADGEQRERMQRFVQAQPLRVGPVEAAAQAEQSRLLGGELLGIFQRGELDVLRLARRLRAPQQHRERIADPWDHHRPAFHAAQAVDALLQRRRLQHLVDVQALRLGHETIHDHRPRSWPQTGGMVRGVALVGAELVEVVVGRRALVLGRRIVDPEFRVGRRLQRRP